ncbi:MAG: hypothetical protein AAGH82_09475 [Pseudomonadota bacterium]
MIDFRTERFAPAALMIFALSTGAASAASCSVSSAGLKCEGETRTEIMQSLASDETSAAFAEPQAFSASLGANGAAREAFRRELESIRRTVERQQRADRLDERRGRIDQAEFALREATYQKAIANYREGYWFYQNLGWRSDD